MLFFRMESGVREFEMAHCPMGEMIVYCILNASVRVVWLSSQPPGILLLVLLQNHIQIMCRSLPMLLETTKSPVGARCRNY